MAFFSFLKRKKKAVIDTWEDFVNAMGERESSNSYTAKNQYGFLGRFQFGKPRLSDFGLTKKMEWTDGSSPKCFIWVPPFSEEKFLASKSLQDAVFEMHVSQHRKRIVEKYGEFLGREVSGVKITLSGAVAVFHLLGEGGFKALIQGQVRADANGTQATEYLELFSDYNIPEILSQLGEEDLKYYAYSPQAGRVMG